MYIMVITANDQNFFQILPRCFCIITFHVYITKHLFLSLRILYVFSFSSNFWVIIYWSTFIILCIILLSGFEWVLFRTLINYLYFYSTSNRLSPSSVFSLYYAFDTFQFMVLTSLLSMLYILLLLSVVFIICSFFCRF